MEHLASVRNAQETRTVILFWIYLCFNLLMKFNNFVQVKHTILNKQAQLGWECSLCFVLLACLFVLWHGSCICNH